jgi:hypothetical protein
MLDFLHLKNFAEWNRRPPVMESEGPQMAFCLLCLALLSWAIPVRAEDPLPSYAGRADSIPNL